MTDPFYSRLRCTAARLSEKGHEGGAGRTAPAIFAICAFAYVALIWGFPYLPTYDGPVHLASAVVWARLDQPETRYREFYVFTPKQVPNLTSQLALAGLVQIMHPLTAEKVLVTTYLMGLAAAFWYFVTAFESDARWLAPLGLLFLFNRALLIGLYNYSLSLIAFWYVGGYCARRATRLCDFDALKLAWVLMAAYCTHLVGWALSVIAAFWFTASLRGHRARNFLCLAAGAAPSSLFAVDYGMQTEMAGPAGVPAFVGQALRRLSLAGLEERLGTLGGNVFGPLAPAGEMFSCTVFIAYGVLIAAALFCQIKRGRMARAARPLALAVLLFIAYFVLPEDLGPHGGLLVVRLIFLPPMLLVGLLRLPKQNARRFLTFASLYGLLLVNLASAASFFRRANADIDEYLAGVEVIGKNAAIFTAVSPDGSYWPEHLRHAAGYYCLTTGSIALDNFQGAPGPFWIQFRPGVVVGLGDMEHYSNKSLVDYLLIWHDRPYPIVAPAGCREVFSRGRLHVFITDRRLAPGGP